MKICEWREEAEKQQSKTDTFGCANRKLHDEKLQIAYNYGLNIIQNTRLSS